MRTPSMIRLSTRSFCTSGIRRNLFGGGKTINAKYDAPSGKSETTSNPVDLLKKNDILMYSEKPLNYIESIKPNGFHYSNNIFISSPNLQGQIIGSLMLESETFEVNFGKTELMVAKTKQDLDDIFKHDKQFIGVKLINNYIIEFNHEILSIFDKVNPKPEILIIGLGKTSRMLSEKNRKYLISLGIQLEVSDSVNSARVFDLLATERPNIIGGLLLPPNL